MHYSTSTTGCTLWLALLLRHHGCTNGYHRDPATGRPIGEPLTADTFVVPHGLQFPRGAAGIESAVHSVCSDDRDMAAIVW